MKEVTFNEGEIKWEPSEIQKYKPKSSDFRAKKREFRPPYMSTEKPKEQDNISMKWKFFNFKGRNS